MDAVALADEVQTFASAAAVRAEVREREVVRHVAVGGAAGVAAGLCLGALYAVSITRPLRTAVGVAARLAAGDRRFEVPAGGRDETGALLRAMGGMAAEIAEDEEALRRAHERSERLLLNILPRAIADRLNEDQSAIADGFAEATILFADVVGFTA